MPKQHEQPCPKPRFNTSAFLMGNASSADAASVDLPRLDSRGQQALGSQQGE
jgi:hypothetical protein